MSSRVSAIITTVVFCTAIGASFAAQSKAVQKPSKSIVTLPIDGQKLFLNTCSTCHGASGNGDEGPSLHGIGLDQDMIKGIVQRGFPGQMPSFVKRFKPAELDAVAKYAAHFDKGQ